MRMGAVLCGLGSSREEDLTLSSAAVSEEGQGPQEGAAKSEYSEDKEIWRVSLGAGCYWGTEAFMKNKFVKQPNLPDGKLLEGAVGFMGPASAPANPTYAQVCTGGTKHVEVYDVKFAGGAAFFEAMLKFYFMFHDPTTRDRQGGDRGTQYASVIYCYNKKQFDIAKRVRDELQDHINQKRLGRVFTSSRVCTDVRMVESIFYPAHLEHQDYLTINPGGYCNHSMRFTVWPTAEE